MQFATIRVVAPAIVALATLAACSGGAQSETARQGWRGTSIDTSNSAAVENGRRIADAQCSKCHAIDRTSSSPRPDAPPLRQVLAIYDTDNLAYRFIEGMRVGHDDMPLFDFDVRTADDLLAYIASISGP